MIYEPLAYALSAPGRQRPLKLTKSRTEWPCIPARVWRLPISLFLPFFVCSGWPFSPISGV